MSIAGYMEKHGHEQLSIWTDHRVGLRAYIAIHDTTLGPSLGGVRIWPHTTEEEAVMDVLRLSRAMTFKSAVAGLPLGGGKGLIVADPKTSKTEALMRSYGTFVESLGGRYITTEDVGSTTQDLEWVSYETRHVVGLSESLGGSGNPSTVTAYGVFQGMKACAQAKWGSDSLTGKLIALQGFGNVASTLATHLLNAGANLIITDIDQTKRNLAKSLSNNVSVVDPETILSIKCDILAPCALGGILNETTIPNLQCEIVCGAANNQLESDVDATRLMDRNIIYAPDYVVNAGGVINVYYELGQAYTPEPALQKASEIYDTTLRLIRTATQQGISTATAADNLALTRLQEVDRSGRN